MHNHLKTALCDNANKIHLEKTEQLFDCAQHWAKYHVTETYLWENAVPATTTPNALYPKRGCYDAPASDMENSRHNTASPLLSKPDLAQFPHISLKLVQTSEIFLYKPQQRHGRLRSIAQLNLCALAYSWAQGSV